MSKYDEFITDKMFPDCPIRNILARIASKWSLLAIYTLNGRVMRFNALQRGSFGTIRFGTGLKPIKYKFSPKFG